MQINDAMLSSTGRLWLDRRRFLAGMTTGLGSMALGSLLRDEAILGVLTGSMVALVLASVLVSWRARHYRRLERAGGSPAEEVAP